MPRLILQKIVYLIQTLILVGLFILLYGIATGNPYTFDIAKNTFLKKQIECMSLNVYYEARGQGKYEWDRVIEVTTNRVKSKKYPNNVCDVVYQAYQFSWTIWYSNVPPKDTKTYEKIKRHVWDRLTNGTPQKLNGALYYHAHYVAPKWSRKKKIIYKTNYHVYYK